MSKRKGESSETLRALPGVDQVLNSPAAAPWLVRLPRERVADLVREAIAELRESLLADASRAPEDPLGAVAAKVGRLVQGLSASSLQPVINASGVILHTNLGRAPLGQPAAEAVRSIAAGYCNLEYDVEQGRRGRRDVHCGSLLERLLGAPALVVNNNAAAIFLVLHELARDGEVIVSRGELVEIGDGFRIPDILEASQARLREVGSTNRTNLDDYRDALGERTRALLRIHPSNFKQVGFTGRPTIEQLVGLAKSVSLPLIEDLGSGCLTDRLAPGIEGEPPVSQSIRAGVSLVTFSGDKLLGGPQAGIIAGDPDLVARVRRNPLFRALRVGKLTLAALEATLRSYLAGREDEIPALRLMRVPADVLSSRAHKLAQRLVEHGVSGCSVVAGESLLGGGSTPMQRVPSPLVAIEGRPGATAAQVESGLRSYDPPVVARIEKNRVLLDLRTVPESQEDDLVAAVIHSTRPRKTGA
ncbi:MAG: L-seryl-tRNA(Sec) selenium transferase [Bryobacterales bacterium]|nr:L-seryl-tRNA(Sec) selenium transferase [Bryobacterales bacterium]MDE0624220.1 L-seryl-tRNA(Sec) selenium transferase [Bryobacterales bacterium]